MIKVLVVEDSPIVREFLVHILGADPDIRVVGTAQDGEDAIEAVQRLRPDVVTMDIHMPKLDGLEARRRRAAAGSPSPWTNRRTDCGRRCPACSARSPKSTAATASPGCCPAWAVTAPRS